MHILSKKWWVGLFVLLLIFYFWPSFQTLAVLSSCSASSTPNIVNLGSTTDINFSLQNTDSTLLVEWIQVSVPSPNFTISSASVSGWAYSFNSDHAIFSDGSILPGSSIDFTLSTTADDTPTAGESWNVIASDDPGGANAITCSGAHNLNILSPPVISNIQLSSIATSSATISWTTNTPTKGNIDYGLTDNYGSATQMSTSFVTSHQQTISGLTANTGYHFMIYGIDQYSNTTYSSDNTFLTAPMPVSNNQPTSTSPTVTNSQPHSVVVVNKKTPNANTTPPQVALNTNLSQAYTAVPTLTGTASDNVAVAKVDYSTDGGQNWLPVDILTTAGQPNVTFAFTPLLPLDGNYVIEVRATDSSGNTTTTAPQTLSIDSLPPLVGGNIVSVGPQVLQPSANGTIQAQAGVNEKITLSTIGAPTNVSLNASMTTNTKTGSQTYTQTFILTPSADSGLWSGVLGFVKPGVYKLTVNSLDGAGHQSSRTLTSVYVSNPGQTLSSVTNKPIVSTVTAYYFEPSSQTWEVWDAAAFGQQNPQTTGKTGNFSMFLPAGKYYLQATAPNYHKLISSIFTINQPTPLSTDLKLNPRHGLHIGPLYFSLPSFSIQHIMTPNSTPVSVSQNSLIGQPAPDLSLTDTAGNIINPTDLLGRPTLLSFNSTWAPTTIEELSALSNLQANPNLNVIPVALQENSGVVQAYTSIADVNLKWLLDPDSTLSTSYNIQSLPMNYFIDRNGIVRQVVVGVMSQQQMLNDLSGL